MLANCSFFFFFEISAHARGFSYQFVAVVIDRHFARTFNEYNSPVTTHATGPHEQAKKKMSKKTPFRQHRINQVSSSPSFFLLAKERDKSDLKTYKYKQKQSQHAAQQYYPPKPPSP